MASDAMREAFEAWATEGGIWPAAARRSGDGYMLAWTQNAWTVWQAAFPAAIEAARLEAFTKEQRQDLLSAALYISARDDDSAVLTSEDAERIVELLCRLSGYEHLLEEVPDDARSLKESP